MAHQGQLTLAFEQTLLMQQRRQVDVAACGYRTAPFPACQMSAHTIRQRYGFAIIEHQIEMGAALEQQSQACITLGILERLIHTQFPYRSLGTQADAGPGLLAGVTVLTKQHAFPVAAPGQQHQQCLRLGKAGQVMEVTVLTERVVTVMRAGHQTSSPQQHHAILRQALHQRLAPGTVLIGRNRSRTGQGFS